MPLTPLDRQTYIDRAAPADLQHVAQAVDAGRLAHEAEVGLVAMLAHVIDQFPRAVQRLPFLVAGKR